LQLACELVELLQDGVLSGGAPAGLRPGDEAAGDRGGDDREQGQAAEHEAGDDLSRGLLGDDVAVADRGHGLDRPPHREQHSVKRIGSISRSTRPKTTTAIAQNAPVRYAHRQGVGPFARAGGPATVRADRLARAIPSAARWPRFGAGQLADQHELHAHCLNSPAGCGRGRGRPSAGRVGSRAR